MKTVKMLAPGKIDVIQTEKPKLEIPEDAEPAPEIKEDEKSAETPEHLICMSLLR